MAWKEFLTIDELEYIIVELFIDELGGVVTVELAVFRAVHRP